MPCFDLVDDRRHALMVLGVAELLCLQHAPLFRYYLPHRPAQERQGHHHEHQDRSAKPSSEPKLPRKVPWAGASAIVSQVRGRFAPWQRPHGQLLRRPLPWTGLPAAGADCDKQHDDKHEAEAFGEELQHGVFQSLVAAFKERPALSRSPFSTTLCGIEKSLA